ncbi:MAG: hypothetical protein GKC03_06190 [Methanomassiliicoccales archaeon]|nr:hypothetical protein [Methanomassiliicoccales archaeon]NYT15289.1 hypothetical protein [Methanomassiliicoccales archaeon]
MSILFVEVASLIALVQRPSEDLPWILVATGLVFFMGALLLFDRISSFTLVAGVLIIVDLMVASIVRGFDVLYLWSLLAIGIFSIILGIAAAGQSRIVSGIAEMDEDQERYLLREVLRSIGISLLAIFGVMVLSLAVLSLTFLAEIGLSSAAALAALAIVTMVSLGALVAMRERI